MEKKHAYLIMAHNNLYVLERLIKLLDNIQNDIYIHLDKKVGKFDCSKYINMCAESKVIFVKKRISVTWGNETQIKAEIAFFEEAYKYGPYAYYHFVSGSDLPLKTQKEIHDFFENKSDNYLFYYDNPTVWDIERISRYRNFVRWHNCIGKKLNEFLNIVQAKYNVNRLKKWKKYPIIKRGWNWCDLTQEAVELILAAKSDIAKMTRFSVCADEMYKQIILLNANFPVYKEENSDGIRYIDWSGGGNHPHIFTMHDYDRLMNSQMLFARKFDENTDKEIVNKIYEELRGKS